VTVIELPATNTPRETPFGGLDPEIVVAAVASMGLEPDGRLLPLNSYENRVYRVGIEPAAVVDEHPLLVPDAVVVKFYRPGRWTDAQIREEHDFAAELTAAELPVAAPLYFAGESLHWYQHFRFALFSCLRATAPDLDAPGARPLLGRTLGRMHAMGSQHTFRHRESLAHMRFGERARESVLELGIIPAPIDQRYADVTQELIELVRDRWQNSEAQRPIRLHGDCHLGNILWSKNGPVFVDLDDCLMGPRVQDLWMFCSGSPMQQQLEWTQVIEGYAQFADFDYAEVALIESLRAIRMMNHAAWLATRWPDPAFPRAFPWFAETRYWEQHVADLAEQIEAVRDPPLLRLC
jgi:Ser/Thr protein kinase RdoA (MazF antagonist)